MLLAATLHFIAYYVCVFLCVYFELLNLLSGMLHPVNWQLLYFKMLVTVY
jgi:hypothetical protein